MHTKLVFPLVVALPDKPDSAEGWFNGNAYSYDMSGIRSSKTVVIREVEAHTHEYSSVVTAPTCTTAGYTTYTCECGESYVDNLVDALGHSYVQSGNVYTCSRCGDSYAGHEHSYTESTTDPTCTEAGYTLYTCSCGDSYTVDLPALGHDYVLVNQSGTIGTYQCTRCGHTYSATIPVNPPTEEYSLRSTAATVEYHEYIYASGRLMRETITTTDAEGNDTTQILDFIYGSGSTSLALVYTNGTASPVTYYYVTNIQGDVVKLVTAGGTVVASYTYDAWGRVLSATGSMAEVNPIRYRGYYYDTETGLYYLQSRYYDPAVKRFINADGIASTGQGFTGFNMFAYCNSNPVASVDFSGNAAGKSYTTAYIDTATPFYPNSPSGTSAELKRRIHALLPGVLSREAEWNQATQLEKQDMLQSFANSCAEILGIDAPMVVCNPNQAVKGSAGYDYGDENNIVNRIYVEYGMTYQDSIYNVIHEIYHAYQYAVTDSYMHGNWSAFSEPGGLVLLWIEARSRYDEDNASPNYGDYYNNAFEIGANWFAGMLDPSKVDASRWSGYLAFAG